MAKNKGFNPDDYTEVKDRLKWYKDDYSDYRVETELVAYTDGMDSVVVKASIYQNKEQQQAGTPHATGIAEELRDAGFVNKTSHVENAETSAIGRALANIDYHGSDKRPSKEEMEKVKRTKKAKNEKEEVKEEVQPTPDEGDEVVEKMNSMDTVNEVVEYFNDQVKKRSGKDKDEFQRKYGQVANERVQEIKGE